MKTKFFIIFLLFFLNITLVAQDLRVLSSNSTSIVVEYTPVVTDTSEIYLNGEKFINFNIPGTSLENIYETGKPQQPVKLFNIGVPSEYGNTIQIISSEYSVLRGNYFPNPDMVKDSVSYHTTYNFPNYSIIEEGISNIVEFGEFGLVRNLQVQGIKVYPVEFLITTKEVRLYKKIIFSLTFGRPSNNLTTIKEEFLAGVVLNWDAAKNWGIAQATLRKTTNTDIFSGPWYRFETPTEGIYRIDRTFLQGLGIDVNSVDPRTIKIFSGGGYSLNEDYTKPRPELGFEEVSILAVGEQDGSFDPNDYILFYGRNTEFWEYNSAQSKIVRVKQPYTKTNYYWLTHSGENGKRVVEKPSLNLPNPYQQTFTLSYYSNDKDSLKAGPTGREYYGDEFNANRKDRTYMNQLHDIVPGSRINYRFRMINSTESVVGYSVYENNNRIFGTNISSLYDYIYGISSIGSASYQNVLPDNRSNLRFQIETSAASAKVYLDYFEIEYQRHLKALADNLLFFSKDTTALVEYNVTNFSNSLIQVFDVTDYSNVKLINGAAISGGEYRFRVNEAQKQVSRYFAVNSSAYKTPLNGVQVTLSNIRENTSGTEMIVITNKVLRSEAERYASYRSSQAPSRTNVSIFYVDDIMNEFSAGLLDPTAIRDFIKFAYDNWQTKPFYVLLFGDGDFDYLNTINEDYEKNLVPTYQTLESLSELRSYPMDDYFVRVSGNDVWGPDKKIDLTLGRLCVQNLSEAAIAINKIIEYENDLEKGLWRTNITLVGDDGPARTGVDEGSTHTRQAEELAIRRIPKYFDLNKIYLAAYPTVITGLGRRKPDVNKAIVDAINNGTLIVNFTGHGNPNTWTHEFVFERVSTIPQLKNRDYFFLAAATCDFGRFDNPDHQSSTEIMINMRNAGSIGTFTATRVVYADANAALNETFYENLFSIKNENNKPVSVGMAYFLTKQTRTAENDEKFSLFGDPFLTLNMPVLPTVIDSVNNQTLQSNVQINALGEVKINGSVKSLDSSPSNYSGEAIISVFDSEKRVELREMNYTVSMQGGLIYRGRTNVSNGQFQTEFVVPKDISYENKNGKIIAYFYDDNYDGIGYTSNIVVGGTNPNAVDDGKGPEIEIYFDDESYKDSYLVNQNFLLIAKLSDQTGLNTTGTGIGHKLEGILNNNENNAIDFTNFFVGDLNSGGKSGVIRYRFSSMDPGDYSLRIKAWDVFNNFSSEVAYFTVISDETGLVVRDVYNYPNPFSSYTTFTFQHNISSPINAKIKVYTVAGRLIKEIEERDILNKFARIDWDGRDNDGNQLANGTYLYRLTVESIDGNYKNNVLGKLAVIR